MRGLEREERVGVDEWIVRGSGSYQLAQVSVGGREECTYITYVHMYVHMYICTYVCTYVHMLE